MSTNAHFLGINVIFVTPNREQEFMGILDSTGRIETFQELKVLSEGGITHAPCSFTVAKVEENEHSQLLITPIKSFGMTKYDPDSEFPGLKIEDAIDTGNYLIEQYRTWNKE